MQWLCTVDASGRVPNTPPVRDVSRTGPGPGLTWSHAYTVHILLVLPGGGPLPPHWCEYVPNPYCDLVAYAADRSSRRKKDSRPPRASPGRASAESVWHVTISGDLR